MTVNNKSQRKVFGMMQALKEEPAKYNYFKKQYGKEFADKLKHGAFGGKGKIVKKLKPMNAKELKAAASVDDKEIPKRIIIRKKTNEGLLFFEDFILNNY